MPAAKSDGTIYIAQVKVEAISVALIGTTPYIHHRMSPEQRLVILAGGQRKTAAEKASTNKHDPMKEYRDSVYRISDANAALGVRSSAIKGAMMTAALDLPGTRKAQIGRLVYVEGEYVPIFGIPKFYMADVRMADMSHTPDVRTRAIMGEWAALVRIRYVVPNLTATAMLNLLGAAGTTAGIGDWRPEKGKGNYGQFYVTTEDDPDFLRIKAEGGRDAQLAALETVEFYDEDTADLFALYQTELRRRGR